MKQDQYGDAFERKLSYPHSRIKGRSPDPCFEKPPNPPEKKK